MYDFDRILDRSGTHSLKWDHCERTFGLDDVIPMWVADMDFEAPPRWSGLRSRAAHGACGCVHPDSFWRRGYWLATARVGVKRWLAVSRRRSGLEPVRERLRPRAMDRGAASVTTRSSGRCRQWPATVAQPAAGNGGASWWISPTWSRIDARTDGLCSPHNPVGGCGRPARGLDEVCERDLIVLADETTWT
jgi:hypothetical protein